MQPNETGNVSLKQVEIYTDGACRGNPGPGGWGVVLRRGAVEKELYGGVSQTTNNQMEMTAVIRALDALTEPCEVTLYTDSKYVIEGITKWIHGWKRNGWRTAGKQPVKNSEFWQQLDKAAARHSVQWKWVKGHSGHPENERADQLANRGIDELQQGTLTS